MVELTGELPDLDKQKKHTIEIVVDRLVVKPGIEKRLADSLETAIKVSGGLVVHRCRKATAEETLSQSYSCVDCGTSLTEITPRLFSFNTPYGACPTCSGLGTLMGVDPDKIVPDPERAIDAGAVAPWPEGSKSWRHQDGGDARQGDGLLARDAVATAARRGETRHPARLGRPGDRASA